MKRHIYTQTAILAAALTLSACVKDDQPVQNDSAPEGGTVISLNVEQPVEDSTGAPAQKVVFNGSGTSWGAGDRLWVNGNTYNVNANNNTISMEIPASGYLLAVTDGVLVNASNYTTYTSTAERLTIAYPRSYTYSSSNNYSGLPLLGMAERTASSITMKQLTTMVKVTVYNSLDKPITVTSIEVSSDKQVSGNVPVDVIWSGGSPTLAPIAGTSTAAADKKVTLSDINVTIPTGASQPFYVPIAPSGDRDISSDRRQLTVKVNMTSNYALPAGVISHQAITTQYGTFSKTMETATLQRRAYIYEAFASITLRSQDGIVDPYFATGSNGKLYVSMGNLVAYYTKNTNDNTEQYYYAMLDVGESLADDYWAYNNGGVFHPNSVYGRQYNYDSDNGSTGLYNPTNYSERYNHYGTFYLFSYGTSGYNSGANIYQPWQAQNTSSSKYTPGGTENQTIQNKRDWGYGVERMSSSYWSGSNPRVNHWTTPTRYEWLNNIVAVGRHAYVKITNVPILGTVNGMVVLPQEYNGPRPAVMASSSDPVSLQYYNMIPLTTWQQMRAYGAVFLPATTKYRNGTTLSATASNKMTLPTEGAGCYWTSNQVESTSDMAYAFRFDPHNANWKNGKAGVCERNSIDSDCENTNALYLSYGLQVRLIRWSSGEN